MTQINPTGTGDRPVLHYGHGISAVDARFERPMHNAVHLLVEGGRAAVIDTGTSHSVPHVLAALADQGIAPEQVAYVILTHVHLDHAGGAGPLMARCPNAMLTVHPRGARHMADPSRLLAGTLAVYGEEATRRLYGEVLPVPAQRILETPEGASVSLGGRELRFLDAPGHARHHVVVHDTGSGHVFAGDSFGVSYRELDQDGRQYALPTTSPVQFDPDALHRTVDRMLALRPGAVYVTHYSQVRSVEAAGADLHRLIDAHVAIGRRHREAGAERHARMKADITELVRGECRLHGWRMGEERALELLALDIELNAQGLGSWLDAG